MLLGAVSPLVGGGIIAYLVNILMSSYERHYFPRSQGFAARTRRPVCLTAAYLTLAAIVAGLIWLVIPELVDCVQGFVMFFATINLIRPERWQRKKEG